jgi:hypothetical protein
VFHNLARTGIPASAVLAITCVCHASPSFADCETPHLQRGRVWEDSRSVVRMSVSMSINGFAPKDLVCAVQKIRQQYSGRNTLSVFLFSSADAARQWLPFTPDKESAPSDVASDKNHAFDSDLHAVYSFVASPREEYVILKPLGGVENHPTDTKISLPVSVEPTCTLRVNNRCLLALDQIVYPADAYKAKDIGVAKLAVTVLPNGRVASVQRVSFEGRSEASIVGAAVNNASSWRFERSTRIETFNVAYNYGIDRALQSGTVDVNINLPTEIIVRAGPLLPRH